MVAWFLAFVDAAVEKPGTEVAPKPAEPWTLPFHKTTDCLAPTTPDPTFFEQTHAALSSQRSAFMSAFRPQYVDGDVEGMFGCLL